MSQDRIYLGDTAILEAFLFDEDGVTPLPAHTVAWKIKKPDGTTDPGGPLTLDDSVATVAYPTTDQVGQYVAQITFTLTNGNKKSVPMAFEVIDPLETTFEDVTELGKTIDLAWMKLEDLFDSDLGGPWLRDKSKQIVDREKLKRFADDALYDINFTYQPETTYDAINFPFLQHRPLFAQALLIQGIRHLMRSYTEQPLLTGAPVNYLDRRDYLNRWQLVYKTENEKFMEWLDLFKRQDFQFGSTAMLVGGYSSWFGRYPRYIRGRYPYIIRYF